MERVFYLGACSPEGFVSHYDSLLEEVENLTVIKGGSGCGKSTFMRAIAQCAEKKGMKVEYILCASDPDSLDGIVIPKLSMGFVDGTAPHVLEPKLCGGSMNYLNFGVFYDSAAMKPNEPEMKKIQKLNAAQYPKVTSCMAAAERLTDWIRSVTDLPAYREEMGAIGACLAMSALREPGNEEGKVSRRFLSAVTPKGLRVCTSTPSTLCGRVYVLRDNYLLGGTILSFLAKQAREKHYDCIQCFSPMRPDGEPTHLLIPGAGTAFVTECRDFPYDGESFCRIDLDSTVHPKQRKELEFCLKHCSALLYQASVQMREAKNLHDKIELLCRPFVNFQAVEEMTRRVAEQIFS